MKKKLNNNILKAITVMFLSPIYLFSDSAITSTDFFRAYLDVELVENAHNTGELNMILAEALSNETPLDIKIAIINALSWDVDGKDNAVYFKKYLLKKYNIYNDNNFYDIINDEEILCLSYLTVMDDYFNPLKAIDIMENI